MLPALVTHSQEPNESIFPTKASDNPKLVRVNEPKDAILEKSPVTKDLPVLSVVIPYPVSLSIPPA